MNVDVGGINRPILNIMLCRQGEQFMAIGSRAVSRADIVMESEHEDVLSLHSPVIGYAMAGWRIEATLHLRNIDMVLGETEGQAIQGLVDLWRQRDDEEAANRAATRGISQGTRALNP